MAYSGREILMVLVVFAALATTVFYFQAEAFPWWPPAFADYLDPIIAIGTLLVAGVVWRNEKEENWRARLPKKLNILYLIDRKTHWDTHVTVIDAPLVGESDIRQWGQSIGQTIFPQEGEKFDQSWARINFTGFFIGTPKLDRKRKVMAYELLVFLRDPIKGAQEGHCYVFDANGSKWQDFPEVPAQCQDASDNLQLIIPEYPHFESTNP
jgi:hypothetical protein